MSGSSRRSKKKLISSNKMEKGDSFSNSEAREALEDIEEEKREEEKREEDREPSFPGERENDNVELTEVTVGFNYGDKVKKSGKER